MAGYIPVHDPLFRRYLLVIEESADNSRGYQVRKVTFAELSMLHQNSFWGVGNPLTNPMRARARTPK